MTSPGYPYLWALPLCSFTCSLRLVDQASEMKICGCHACDKCQVASTKDWNWKQNWNHEQPRMMGYVYVWICYIYNWLHWVLHLAITLGYQVIIVIQRNEQNSPLSFDAKNEHLAQASCKFLALTPTKWHPTMISTHYALCSLARRSCKYKQVPSFFGRSAHSMMATCSMMNLKHTWWWSVHTLSWKSHMNLFIPLDLNQENLKWRFQLTGFTSSNVNGVTQNDSSDDIGDQNEPPAPWIRSALCARWCSITAKLRISCLKRVWVNQGWSADGKRSWFLWLKYLQSWWFFKMFEGHQLINCILNQVLQRGAHIQSRSAQTFRNVQEDKPAKRSRQTNCICSRIFS